MRTKEEIKQKTCYNSTNPTSMNQFLIIEILLDIRDQNEEIKNQLIIMNNGLSIKDFKATSIDISVDKICDKDDDKI